MMPSIFTIGLTVNLPPFNCQVRLSLTEGTAIITNFVAKVSIYILYYQDCLLP
jgi:hypothetical protein